MGSSIDAVEVSVFPKRGYPVIVETDAKAARRNRSVDNLLVAVMLVCSGAFAATFAASVLGGATRSLAASSAEAWSPEGP